MTEDDTFKKLQQIPLAEITEIVKRYLRDFSRDEILEIISSGRIDEFLEPYHWTWAEYLALTSPTILQPQYTRA